MATKQPEESNKQPQSERGNAIIRDSPTAGRGLFATRDIPAGDLIFYIQRPLLCVADRARLEDTCANCLVWVNGFSVEERGTGSDPVTLKACLRCKQVKYCSKVGAPTHFHEASILNEPIEMSITGMEKVAQIRVQEMGGR